MLKKIILVSILFLLITSSICISYEDLSKGNADFFTINLGESKYIFLEKIKSFKENIWDFKLISNDTYFGSAMFLNEETCFILSFQENILSSIRIYFKTKLFILDKDSKEFILEKINSWLTDKYGKATEIFDYPEKAVEDYIILHWILSDYKDVTLELNLPGYAVLEIKKTRLPSVLAAEQKKEDEKRKKEERSKAYSQIKGDFKVLCLGDSKEIAEDKQKYLCDQEEIDLIESSYNPHFLTTILKNYVYIYPEYFDNKLFRLFITFPYCSADFLDTKLKDFVLKELKPMLIQAYGKPTNIYQYPSILEMTNSHYKDVFQWILAKKTIVLGIYEKDSEFAAIIDMTHNKLLEEKKKSDKDQKQKDINSSANDF